MSIRMTLLTTAFASLLALPAMAQQTAAPASPPPTAATTAATNTTATAAPTRRDTIVERRIADLRSNLKITAAEQKPFEEFAQAMRDNARRMDEAVSAKRTSAATATAVEQMRAYAELAQAHSEEVNRLVAPFATLYDALSPDQRKMADQSFRKFSSGAAGRG